MAGAEVSGRCAPWSRNAANPECSSPFVHYRAGKIYRVDRGHAMNSWVPQVGGQQKIEHFWLCGKCSPTLTVVLHSDGSVAVSKASLVNTTPPWARPRSLGTKADVASVDLSTPPERECHQQANSRPR